MPFLFSLLSIYRLCFLWDIHPVWISHGTCDQGLLWMIKKDGSQLEMRYIGQNQYWQTCMLPARHLHYVVTWSHSLLRSVKIQVFHGEIVAMFLIMWPHIIKKQKWGEKAWFHQFMKVHRSTGWCDSYRDLPSKGRCTGPAGRRAYHWPVQ